MIAKHPLTIVMTFRDAAKHIEETLASLIGQTFGDFLLIAVDHLSQDESRTIVKDFSSMDERIRLIEYPLPNTRPSDARSFAMSTVESPWVAVADADDINEPNRLAVQMAALRDAEVDVLGAGMKVIDAQGRELGELNYPEEHDEIATALYKRCCVANPTVVCRRSAVEAIGGVRSGLIAYDYDLWLRMREAGYRFANLSELLVQYRSHPTSITAQNPGPGIFQKFNVLCSAAFRQLRGCDPFAGSPNMWDEFQFGLLPQLDERLMVKADLIGASMRASDADMETLRGCVSQAIAALYSVGFGKQ